MKKIISILLTLVMVLSFTAITVFAEGLQQTGYIYINNISESTNYKVYKLFDLESMASNGTSYSYSITNTETTVGENVTNSNPWYTFISSQTQYFTLEEIKSVDNLDGSVTKTYSITKTDAFTESTAVGFAKDALDYANKEGAYINRAGDEIDPVLDNEDIEIVDSQAEVKTGKFTVNTLGYYLVDSSVGALCGLTTTKPEASITVKNSAPTITKTVQEDSLVTDHGSANSFLPSNTAEIGQTILFDVTIFAQAGAQNYIFHDRMHGMEFINPNENEIHFAVLHSKTKQNIEVPITEEFYTINTTNCGVNGCNCTFSVEFDKSFLDTIEVNDKISIEYCGKLNGTANIGNEGNINECWLTYGDFDSEGKSLHTTTYAQTTTYTYGCDIVKTDQNYAPLSGATFKLFADDGGQKREVKLAYKESTNTYRVCTEARDGEVIVDVITVEENEDFAHGFTLSRIVGLDNGVYYVREMTPPDGYNRLTNDVSFTVSNAPYYATFTMTTDNGSENYSYNRGSGVHIENKQGVTMPETGGTGTVMFITIGTIMVLGAGVLLVTKKRMSMIED